jgi:hypothetical protein
MEEKCGSKMEVKLNIKFEAILGAISSRKLLNWLLNNKQNWMLIKKQIPTLKGRKSWT